MKQITRAICILLTLLCSVWCFAACGKAPETEQPGTSGSSVTTDSAESSNVDENGYEKDSIPANTNFGDYTFNILSWAENNDYLFPLAASEKDIISYDIFMRNRGIEETYHCTLKPDVVNGSWSNQETFLSKARMAGELEYDLIASYSLWPTVLAQEGLLANLLTLKFPEVTKPWWSTCAETYTFNGALYYLTCPSSRGAIMNAEVLFANNRLLENHVPDEDVFGMVLDGSWTYEAFLTITEKFKGLADAEDEGSRIYALTVDDDSRMDAFYYGAGFRSVVRNTDGSMSLGFTSRSRLEQITSYADSLFALFRDDNGFVVHMEDNISEMKTGRSVFTVAGLASIQQLPDNSTYAPIPLPKYNPKDTRYYTCQTNAYDIWCIPKTTARTEDAGIIAEAVASSDYRSIFPKFYEDKLKLRYADDVIGYQIFDIIRDSIITDFGRLEQLSLNNCGIEGIWRQVFTPNSEYYGNFMSRYDSMNGDGQLEIALNKLLKAYRNAS